MKYFILTLLFSFSAYSQTTLDRVKSFIDEVEFIECTVATEIYEYSPYEEALLVSISDPISGHEQEFTLLDDGGGIRNLEFNGDRLYFQEKKYNQTAEFILERSGRSFSLSVGVFREVFGRLEIEKAFNCY